MKKFFFVVLYLLLFLCPLAAKAKDVETISQEEIVEALSPDPMSDEAIRDLQIEDMYQGTFSWQGKSYYQI